MEQGKAFGFLTNWGNCTQSLLAVIDSKNTIISCEVVFEIGFRNVPLSLQSKYSLLN